MSDSASRSSLVDPAVLTTDQLRREMLMLRELLETRLGANEKAADVFADNLTRVPSALDREISKLTILINEKFDGVQRQLVDRDKRAESIMAASQQSIETALRSVAEAGKIFQTQVNQMPTETAKSIDHLRGLQQEKFDSIQRQFDERDIRSRASETAASVAVTAALQAQKEAAAQQQESNSVGIAKSENATTKQLDGILALFSTTNAGTSDKLAAINARLDRTEGKSTGLSSNLATGIAAIAVLVALLSATGVFSGNRNSSPIPGPAGSVTVPIPAQR